jgi:hypothetical protein
MAQTVDFSSLSVYTDQIQLPLMKMAIFPATLLESGITIQEDVTYISTLNILTNTLVAQTGGDCSFGASGSTVLSQKNLQVAPLKFDAELCPDLFKKYWTKQISKKGSYGDVSPDQFNELYYALYTEQVAKSVEDNWFCGSTTATASCNFYNSALTKVDGILHQANFTSASASVVRFGASYSGAWTSTNAVAILDDAMSKIPQDAAMADDLTLFVGYNNFVALSQGIRALNGYAGYVNAAGDISSQKFEMKNPLGYFITVKMFAGLRNTNRAFLTSASNLYLGTDLVSDFAKMRTWESLDNGGVIRSQTKLRLGSQIAFPQLFLQYNG